MKKMDFKSLSALLVLLAGTLAAAEDVKLLVPEKIYAVPGVEMNVYFNNIVTVVNPANYVFDVDCPKGRNDLKRWRFTPTKEDVGTWKWKVRVINEAGVAAEAESEIVVVPQDAGKGRTFSLLIVGASQTGAGHYPNRVAELMKLPGNPDFVSIGTRGKGPGKHEGYGGWRWDSFLTRWGYTGSRNKNDGMHPNRPVGFNSPFLFADKDGKGVFDLNEYFKRNNGGKAPDAVSFQLGLNDFFLATDETIAEVTKKSIANMEKLIGEFRKLKPAPEIFVFQHIPGAGQDGFGKSYSCGRTTWQYRKNLDYYNRALLKKSKELKFIIVPVYINIDTENNYPWVEDAVNADNPAKVQRQNNGVHPAKPGYYQMGDVLYCRLKAWLAENTPKAK
ncbi:MAG: SGNH/GDSL hydrolase family protein [Lentisphaeria bacterium]|nr:SGNH/GDSL hydrolase family protein [Lentisphaeria bacterium]